jgi:TorA maturation chaperone TorD
MSSQSDMSTIEFHASDAGEELARAEVYGLLAALFFAPPSDDLYQQMRVAVTEAPMAGAFLEGSWGALVSAARSLRLEEIEAEHVALFGGVAKPAVCLFSSWYLAGALNQQPLVELRSALAALGLERPVGVIETEDHIASLCEVMRYLIAGDDLGASNLPAQQRFFNRHLRGWTEELCQAIAAQPGAVFYLAVADFARDFFAIEAQGFDLLDA